MAKQTLTGKNGRWNNTGKAFTFVEVLYNPTRDARCMDQASDQVPKSIGLT